MYSIDLFIVETSLSGFFGSGDRPYVGGGQDPGDQLVGRPPGELDMSGQAQFVAQRDQLVEAVARADQREGDVVAAEFVHHDVSGPDHDVDPVLRSHDADVGGEELSPATLGRVGRAALAGVRVRAGADDGDVGRRLPLRPDRDVAVGVVGGDHVVRGPVRPALQRAQPQVRQLRPVGKPGLEQFRAQVVVVENELRPLEGRKATRSARRCPAGCTPG